MLLLMPFKNTDCDKSIAPVFFNTLKTMIFDIVITVLFIAYSMYMRSVHKDKVNSLMDKYDFFAVENHELQEMVRLRNNEISRLKKEADLTNQLILEHEELKRKYMQAKTELLTLKKQN